MLPAVQIADESLRVPDRRDIAAAVAGCRYRLPGAETGVWKSAMWQVVEQAYDLPNVYATYIEVRTDGQETLLPIRCPQHDLYWLYALEGRLAFASADGRRTLVSIRTASYRVSYLPAGTYTCRFPEGIHQIFYVVHKPAALFREESHELEGADVFAAVQMQLEVHATTDSLAMQDGSGSAIRRFLSAPGESYIKRTQRLKHLAYELIVLSHRSMVEHEDRKKTAADWAEGMKTYIDERIAAGDEVDMYLVAERFRLSVGYVRAIFDGIAGGPVGAYITERKLSHSKILLKSGCKSEQTAHYLGWTRSYFSTKFAARFGETPGDYRKRKGRS